MPKSHERQSHFESISDDNLIKYMHGTPISIVSGKPIKFGSHEHKNQVRAIKKIMLKRRLENHKAEKHVSFADEESKQEKQAPVRRTPRTYAEMDRVRAAVEESSKPLPPREYTPIPKESILNDYSAKSDGVPAHLQNVYVPPISNKPFY
jgi:hypothetical protein